MKDIENAYLAEQKYIENNLGTEVDLLDLLKPFGYETIEEYLCDKFLYMLKKENLTITHCLVADVKTNMFNAIATGNAGVFAPDEDITWALIGKPEYFDYDKAKELGVYACDLGYPGGTIITCNSDFNVTINLPMPKFRMNNFKFLEQFNNFFCEKGFNTHIDNNDILLENGKKVAGSVFIGTEKSGNFSISVSLNDHTELIKQLCKKQSTKEVGYLTGITKQEIEEEFNRWLQCT